ncbi:hypothetical protein D3C83_158320 [compost metagenome]
MNSPVNRLLPLALAAIFKGMVSAAAPSVWTNIRLALSTARLVIISNCTLVPATLASEREISNLPARSAAGTSSAYK